MLAQLMFIRHMGTKLKWPLSSAEFEGVNPYKQPLTDVHTHRKLAETKFAQPIRCDDICVVVPICCACCAAHAARQHFWPPAEGQKGEHRSLMELLRADYISFLLLWCEAPWTCC